MQGIKTGIRAFADLAGDMPNQPVKKVAAKNLPYSRPHQDPAQIKERVITKGPTATAQSHINLSRLTKDPKAPLRAL